MRRPLALLLALVLTTGCSLVNPLVITPEVRQGRGPDGKPLVADPGRMTLPEARQYGERVKTQYRKALRDQAELTAWLGIGLIPLSAAAIGLGARAVAPDAVLALGLGGAAAFGTATWLVNRPRQAAYVAGIKAVTCAEAAIAPLDLDQAEITGLGDNLNTLSDEMPKVEMQAAILSEKADELERDLARLRSTSREGVKHHFDLLAEARGELASARSLVASAESAYVSGVELRRVVTAVGQRLAVAIDKVVDTVDGIIVETQRDPQALSAIISGLGGSYKSFTAVPEALKPSTGKAAAPAGPQSKVPEEQNLLAQLDRDNAAVAGALSALRQEVTRLSKARREVAAVVNTVSTNLPLQALEGCGVKTGDVVTPLAIDPAGPFEVVRSFTVGFTAKGGLSPYWATVRGPGDGLTVTPVAPSSPAFHATAAKDAAIGTYVVSVIDATGAVKQVQIAVKDGAGAGSGGGAGAPPPDGPNKKSAVSEESFRELVREVKGKSIPVPGTGVTLKIGEPQRGDDKVEVPAEVESVTQFNADAFTEAAVARALVGASGLSPAQIAVKNFNDVKARAQEKAKAPSS